MSTINSLTAFLTTLALTVPDCVTHARPLLVNELTITISRSGQTDEQITGGVALTSRVVPPTSVL